jgi:hypothetical protein
MLPTLRGLDALREFLSSVIPEREAPVFMSGYCPLLVENVKAVNLRDGGCLDH